MSNEVEMMNADLMETNKPFSKGIMDGKTAGNKDDFPEEVKISPAEQLRLLKDIRMENLTEGMLSAMEKAVDFELKHYPSVRYSDAELASIKNTVMEKIDDILKRLVC